MSIFICSCCENKIDNDFYQLLTVEDKEYCQDCFENKFTCQDCGGFENNEAAREIDGHYCVCSNEENNE